MQKGTGTNEQTNTDTLDPYDLFSRGLRQSMKWKPNVHQLVKNESRYENQTRINEELN